MMICWPHAHPDLEIGEPGNKTIGLACIDEHGLAWVYVAKTYLIMVHSNNY